MTCIRCKKFKYKPIKKVTELYRKDPYDNGLCLTPPMGWNSWNYFKYDINEKMLLEMAKAIKKSGLADAGYTYLNLDDYWEADRRDRSGLLQADCVRFPRGMKAFVDDCNALGFKVGIYSSNGTLTCQSLPGSLNNEYNDALQFARWGVEYLKYDYCYHKVSSKYGIELFGISVAEKGSDVETAIPPENAALIGSARLKFGASHYNRFCMYHPKEKRKYITGLDAHRGKAVFLYQASKDGKFVLSLDPRFRTSFLLPKKAVMIAVVINGGEPILVEIGKINQPCRVAPVRIEADLKKGNNIIEVFNPIGNRADSAVLNYMCMSNALKEAADAVGSKPIAYSVCEWGRNRPWEWGTQVANLWRTTGDISWHWARVMQIYEKNVKLYPYASVGHWNDPDMLEVGNGKLTADENKAHFSLWCMMASPLLLGNDIVNMKQEHLDILTNKALIAIDQDALGKQAKRTVRGFVDVLVRPLANGSIALCAFNKKKSSVPFRFNLQSLTEESYLDGYAKTAYLTEELWSGEISAEPVTALSATLPPHGVKVWILT